MKFGLVVRINVRIIVRFVILLVWIPVALGQTSTPPDSPAASPNPVLSARSNLVLVPALVRTKSGELVFTLAAKDFTIKDDGVEEKVTLEENTDDEPLALVIAIETGGGGARQLDKYIHLATTIEAVVGGVPHKIAVVGFDGAPTLLQDFTTDLDVVDRAIRGLSPGNAEPRFSMVWDSQLTCCENSRRNIDARFCCLARPSTTAAT